LDAKTIHSPRSNFDATLAAHRRQEGHAGLRDPRHRGARPWAVARRPPAEHRCGVLEALVLLGVAGFSARRNHQWAVLAG
jgi:hypothetical protein